MLYNSITIPPIRRVSTKGKGSRVYNTDFKQRLNTELWQTWHKDSHHRFCRHSALGVRRGGSAGVGGKGGGRYLRLRWPTFGYLGLPWSIAFGIRGYLGLTIFMFFSSVFPEGFCEVFLLRSGGFGGHFGNNFWWHLQNKHDFLEFGGTLDFERQYHVFCTF